MSVKERPAEAGSGSTIGSTIAAAVEETTAAAPACPPPVCSILDFRSALSGPVRSSATVGVATSSVGAAALRAGVVRRNRSRCGLSARRSDSARWVFGQGAAVLEPPMPRRGASRGDGWVAKGRNELPDGVGSVGVEPVPDDGGDRREVAELVWLAAALGVTRITADQRLRSCQSLRSLTVMSTVTLESCCH